MCGSFFILYYTEEIKKINNIMDCCLLCLDFNQGMTDSIETNSKQWQDLDITKVLEKHFWPLNSIQQPDSWICSMCWQEVNNFHNFYLRIEEAHANLGKIKLEEERKKTTVEEMENVSYCMEPEILIDQHELKAEDPLAKPIALKRKDIKPSKAPADNIEIQIKQETTSDSDNSDNEMVSNDDNGSSSRQDKNVKEYKNRKEGDKFIAQHYKQMFCDLCDVPFENFSAMRKHFMSMHPKCKPYLICCNRKFYHRSNLVDHLHKHFNPERFKCTQCGKILSDRKYLEDHMLRVHRPEDLGKKYSCDICGKYFIRASILRNHKFTHVPEEDKKFRCEQCGKLYASSYTLKLHTEAVHFKRVCHVCGKTLPTTAEYEAHLNDHKGIPALIINCDVCGLRLGSERSLKLHKESLHGKRNHLCPLCDKVSLSARALKKHINSMHEKGLDHKCTLCQKLFRRADTLKEHMASHTGTRLYKCPWCPKTFNSSGNKNTHRKQKHPEEYLEQKLQKYL